MPTDASTKTSATEAPACEAMTGTLKSIDAAGAMAAMHSTTRVGKRNALGRSVLTVTSISPAGAETCSLDSDIVM
jgi:hypothetical protein